MLRELMKHLNKQSKKKKISKQRLPVQSAFRDLILKPSTKTKLVSLKLQEMMVFQSLIKLMHKLVAWIYQMLVSCPKSPLIVKIKTHSHKLKVLWRLLDVDSPFKMWYAGTGFGSYSFFSIGKYFSILQIKKNIVVHN